MARSAIITIGNEILLGKTINSNLAYLASELASMGFPVEFSLTVKDEPEAIRSALKQCWERCEIVISTGGLGPTADDITKSEIAAFFGRQLTFREEVWEHVQRLFAVRNLPTPEINRCQAMVPEDFSALRNDRGTAPGLAFVDGEKCFFALAGVPVEMKYVFDTQIKDILLKKYGDGGRIIQKTIHTFGIPESALAEIVPADQLPEGVSLAWLPQTGRVDLRFYGRNEADLDRAIAERIHLIEDKVWGRDDDTPSAVLGRMLLEKGLTLSVAESCTGGLVQKMITDLAGASGFFSGGVVVYSNSLKRELLGVEQQTLDQYGAVSENTALEMAEGIIRLTKSQLAISVTGIAGPDGGTAKKPIGTICFGFSARGVNWALTQVFSGDRASIRFKAAEFAILHLIKKVQGKTS
jgi:nicotinamide-nucleotide amidase